jgi:hypothetical protein
LKLLLIYDETGSLKQLTWAPNVTTNISPYWSMYAAKRSATAQTSIPLQH